MSKATHTAYPLHGSKTDSSLEQTLQKRFGYPAFRGEQKSIIESVIADQDSLVIMPTGAGKSLCYQLPALLKPGMALVISPLIALMKNQIDQLRKLEISAHFLNSTLSRKETTAIKAAAESGDIRLLYTAPESLSKEENIAFFKRLQLSFIAIDEAHCISEWGHDFRPEYRRIREVINEIGRLPIMALTATATQKVQFDIQKNLGIEQANLYKTSFNRPNLFYEVRPKIAARKALLCFLRKHPNQSGIIYCMTRKKVEELSAWLETNNISSTYYHAGLEAQKRIQHQDDFLSQKKQLIVATVAFGMGIDKPDVRFVVHYNPPKSLESYYQETGRAGRDGQPAHCLMFFSPNDLDRIEKLNKDKPMAERDNTLLLRKEVMAYVESPACRRKQLLFYFGEESDLSNCKNCDNCTQKLVSFPAKDYIHLLLKAVKETETRNPISHVVDVLLGKQTDSVEQFQCESLAVFGQGKQEDARFWNALFRQAIYHGFLEHHIELSTLQETLFLTKKGEHFLATLPDLEMFRPHVYPRNKSEAEEEGLIYEKHKQKIEPYDKKLFSELQILRKEVARKHELPPYIIISDVTLQELATRFPTTDEQLLQISGIGRGKAKRWGKPFLSAVQYHVEKYHIKVDEDVLMRSNGQQKGLKIRIIKQVDKQIRLEEIAENLGIKLNELLGEMERICFSGTSLNLDYCLNCLLDQEQQEELEDYFRQSQSDELSLAYEALEDYTEEEIRLMRIKFVSEWGN